MKDQLALLAHINNSLTIRVGTIDGEYARHADVGELIAKVESFMSVRNALAPREVMARKVEINDAAVTVSYYAPFPV